MEGKALSREQAWNVLGKQGVAVVGWAKGRVAGVFEVLCSLSAAHTGPDHLSLH